MKKFRSLVVVGSLSCTAALILGSVMPASAQSGSDLRQESTVSFVDDSCVSQVQKAFEKVKQRADENDLSVCAGKVTVEEGPIETVTVPEARKMVADDGLDKQDAAQVVEAAAAGKIKSRAWKHAYWGGLNYEKHAGRTYWDGSKAWVKKHRGKSGFHTCHSEGSWQVGWSVTPISCTKPGAGSYADSYYRFDASVLVKGSPITLGVGLHYQTSKKGAVKTWQVGG